MIESSAYINNMFLNESIRVHASHEYDCYRSIMFIVNFIAQIHITCIKIDRLAMVATVTTPTGGVLCTSPV